MSKLKPLSVTHRKRLLRVAQACRETATPKDFDMRFFGRADQPTDPNAPAPTCGTPGCALGNFAVRRDLQRVLHLGAPFAACGRDELHFQLLDRAGRPLDYDDGGLLSSYFGLGYRELISLFGATGCGNAKTAKQAARYIERFVAARTPKAG